MGDLIEGHFVEPTHKVELGGHKGLDCHEIARSLGTTFQRVKDAIEREADNLSEFETKRTRFLHPVNGSESDSYVLDVDAAKFIVARFGNKIGAAYCKYLIQQEREWQTVQENLHDPKMAIQFGQALIERAKAQIDYEAEQAKVLHLSTSLTTSQTNNGLKTKENNRLKNTIDNLKRELGNNHNYRTVVGMLNDYPELKAIFHNTSVIGRKLSKISRDMGKEIRKIDDEKWGKVNSYHHAVWKVYLNERGIKI